MASSRDRLPPAVPRGPPLARHGRPATAAEARQRAEEGRTQLGAQSIELETAIEKLQIDELVKKDPWRGPAKSEHGIQSGETLEVWFKPAIDQPEERVVGYCIARHNRGLGSSFRLLCKIDQCPIEYHFQLFSPLLLNVIVRAPRRKTQRKKEKFGRLRSKLYFLRDEVDKLNLPKPTPRPRKEAAPKAKK